jgi:hypothetical protein
MADFYRRARSNYFRVKDIAKFKQWAESIDGLEVLHDDDDGTVGLLSEDGWPLWRTDEETEEEKKMDVGEEVAKHLQEGSVAIFLEIGAEAMRYLAGRALAINSKGETRTVDLRDIYEQAKALGDEAGVAKE